MRMGAAFVVAAALVAGAPATCSAQSPNVDTVLALASRYIGDFVGRFSNVVTEERYIQETSSTNPRSGQNGRRRELKSDFLLVAPFDNTDYIPFRDVFEVDGSPVRDRQQRLAALFLKPSATALDQANAIANESARYNLGFRDMKRTINNPLLALVFLQADSIKRFRYSLDKMDAAVGPNVWILEYREQARPTLIRGAFDKNMPAHGRFWIDVQTGRVAKSELKVDDAAIGAEITTTFRVDDQFQVGVPVEMLERYVLTNGNLVTGTATYGRFRRFGVSTEQNIAEPASNPR
jgi:hypothetical protein